MRKVESHKHDDKRSRVKSLTRRIKENNEKKSRDYFQQLDNLPISIMNTERTHACHGR